MGAVGVKDEIYETVTNDAPKDAIEFFHGYTYSAHPAACAASLTALEMYEREEFFEKAAAMSKYFLDAVFSLKGHPMIKDICGIGLLAGMELHPRGTPGALGRRCRSGCSGTAATSSSPAKTRSRARLSLQSGAISTKSSGS